MMWQPTLSSPDGDIDPEHEQELRLIAHTRAGAAWALSALVARYQPLVVRYLVRLTGDPQQSHRAAESIFVRMGKRLRGPHGGDQLRLWLLRASTDAGLDLLRRAQQRPTSDRLTAPAGPVGLLAGRVGETPVGRFLAGWGARVRPAPPPRQPVRTQEFVWQSSQRPGAASTASDGSGIADEEDGDSPREALRRHMIRTVLAELPFADAQCLSLHLVAGLNQADVAKALGITLPVAQHRIVQGLQLFGGRYDAALASLGISPDFQAPQADSDPALDTPFAAAARPAPEAVVDAAPPAAPEVAAGAVEVSIAGALASAAVSSESDVAELPTLVLAADPQAPGASDDSPTAPAAVPAVSAPEPPLGASADEHRALSSDAPRADHVAFVPPPEPVAIDSDLQAEAQVSAHATPAAPQADMEPGESPDASADGATVSAPASMPVVVGDVVDSVPGTASTISQDRSDAPAPTTDAAPTRAEESADAVPSGPDATASGAPIASAALAALAALAVGAGAATTAIPVAELAQPDAPISDAGLTGPMPPPAAEIDAAALAESAPMGAGPAASPDDFPPLGDEQLAETATSPRPLGPSQPRNDTLSSAATAVEQPAEREVLPAALAADASLAPSPTDTSATTATGEQPASDPMSAPPAAFALPDYPAVGAGLSLQPNSGVHSESARLGDEEGGGDAQSAAVGREPVLTTPRRITVPPRLDSSVPSVAASNGGARADSLATDALAATAAGTSTLAPEPTSDAEPDVLPEAAAPAVAAQVPSPSPASTPQPAGDFAVVGSAVESSSANDDDEVILVVEPEPQPTPRPRDTTLAHSLRARRRRVLSADGEAEDPAEASGSWLDS